MAIRCVLIILVLTYNAVLEASRLKDISDEDGMELNFDQKKLSRHSHWHRMRHSSRRNVFQSRVPGDEERCILGLVPSNFTWKNAECSVCSCNRQQPVCQKIKCSDLHCEERELVDGSCCRNCPEKLCTSRDGRKFPHGAEWHNGDCTFCKCKKGEIFCTVEDCQLPNCPNPVKIPGQCCPVCLTTACNSNNGTRIPAGEVWKEGSCVHCYCAGGEKKCANEKCPYINCTDVYQPENSCCSRCTTGVVDCVVSEWMEWNECPMQECGGGMRRRYRNVLIHPKNGGDFCPHTSEAQLCPQLPCDVLPYCPVSEWGKWSVCTSSCGNGIRLRRRKRLPNKATMIFILDCSQTHMQETMTCYAGSCTSLSDKNAYHEAPLYDDICYNFNWTEWGECSVKCGLGKQYRHQVLVDRFHPRGHLCHLLDETRSCIGNQCDETITGAQRCQVSDWSTWSSCSRSCGKKGHRSRQRTILHPGNGSCPKLLARKICRNKPCRSKSTKCVSEDGRKDYNEGEEWFPNKCIFCTCIHKRIRCNIICS